MKYDIHCLTNQKFIEDLMHQHWKNVYFFAEGLNRKWEIWKKLFLEVINKPAPLQHKKIRAKRIPWLTSPIKKLINTTDKLKSSLECDWKNYKRIGNRVNIELKNAKKEYYSSRIADEGGNPKKDWKTINDLLGRKNKQTVVNELKLGDNSLTKPKDIAEVFNDYFSNIGQNIASNQADNTNFNFETYVKKAESEFTAFQPVTVNQVYQLLTGLSSNKATRVHKISSKIIQIASQPIADSLTHIFNQAVTLSSFPDEWKTARVIPLYKNGQ